MVEFIFHFSSIFFSLYPSRHFSFSLSSFSSSRSVVSLPPALFSSVHPFSLSLNFVFFRLTLFHGQPSISLRQQLSAASSSLFLTFSLSIYFFYLLHYHSILYPPLVSHFPHTPSYIYPSLFIYFINPSLYVFPIKGFITSSLFPPIFPQISQTLSSFSLLFPLLLLSFLHNFDFLNDSF